MTATGRGSWLGRQSAEGRLYIRLDCIQGSYRAQSHSTTRARQCRIAVISEQTVSDVVSLIEEHQVLFCRLCRQAVRPGSGIATHFRFTHHIKGRLLADIQAYYKYIHLCDPVQDALPDDRSRPVQELPVLEGLSCTQCRFLTTARDNMTRH